MNKVGAFLDHCSRSRNQASYDLAASAGFGSPALGQATIRDAADGITLLDAIDGDPARRSAAVAAIPP